MFDEHELLDKLCLSLAEQYLNRQSFYANNKYTEQLPQNNAQAYRQKIHQLASESKQFEGALTRWNAENQKERRRPGSGGKQFGHALQGHTQADIPEFTMEEELSWREHQIREAIQNFQQQDTNKEVAMAELNSRNQRQQLQLSQLSYGMENRRRVQEHLERLVVNLRNEIQHLLVEKERYSIANERTDMMLNEIQLQKEINRVMWDEFIKLESERDTLQNTLMQCSEQLSRINMEKMRNLEKELTKLEAEYTNK
ncbi:unnamed protein product, partial [Mesorhabditis spiculigera]